MEINLKDSLRALRQKKNVTQEALAKHLGITPQSVGKWERGEGFPDITLLPKIALYFGVSIDTLLCVDKMRIEDAINAYQAESARLKHCGKTQENIALWESAAAEFPNDCRVLAGWMNAVAAKAIWPCPKEDAGQIAALGKRILAESTDTKLREDAIQTLCYTYCSIGETKDALRYADMGGSITATREGLSAFALEGEDGVKATQEYLISLLFAAASAASLLPTKANLSAAEEISAYRFGIDLMKLLFPDDNMGFYANEPSRLYACISRVYAKEKDQQGTLAALENCAKYARIAAKAERTPAFSYTAFMVSRLRNDPAGEVKNYAGNACGLRRKELGWAGYDFVRKDGRFLRVEEMLEQGAQDVR